VKEPIFKANDLILLTYTSHLLTPYLSPWHQ